MTTIERIFTEAEVTYYANLMLERHARQTVGLPPYPFTYHTSGGFLIGHWTTSRLLNITGSGYGTKAAAQIREALLALPGDLDAEIDWPADVLGEEELHW